MEILRYDRGTHQKERKYDMKHWNERGTGLSAPGEEALPDPKMSGAY